MALEDLREESRVDGRQVARRRGGAGPGRAVPGAARVACSWQSLRVAALRARRGRPSKPLRAVALTTLPGVEQSPSLSPDGNHVVFAWTGPKQDNQTSTCSMIGSGRAAAADDRCARRLQPGLVARRPVDRLLPQASRPLRPACAAANCCSSRRWAAPNANWPTSIAGLFSRWGVPGLVAGQQFSGRDGFYG